MRGFKMAFLFYDEWLQEEHEEVIEIGTLDHMNADEAEESEPTADEGDDLAEESASSEVVVVTL